MYLYWYFKFKIEIKKLFFCVKFIVFVVCLYIDIRKKFLKIGEK